MLNPLFEVEVALEVMRRLPPEMVRPFEERSPPAKRPWVIVDVAVVEVAEKVSKVAYPGTARFATSIPP